MGKGDLGGGVVVGFADLAAIVWFDLNVCYGETTAMVQRKS